MFQLTTNAALVAALLLTLLTDAASAQDAPEAETILNRVEAAAGDAAARSALKSLRIEGTVSPRGMPMKASFEELHLGKDRAVMTSAYPGMGEMSTGTDGKITWSTDPVMGVLVKKGKDQGGARRVLLLGRRASWRELYTSARLIGEEKVLGRACWKLALKGDDGAEDNWYVDRENHDLVQLEVRYPNFAGGDLPMTWRFGRYEEVGGVRLAHARTQISGTYEITYDVTKIEANPALDPKRLAPPEAVLERLAQGESHPDKATAAGVVKIHQLAKRAVAVSKKTTCKPDSISRTLGSLLPKVMGYLMSSGKSPAGPPFTRYLEMSEEKVVLEAGMPVREPIEAADGIVPSWLPAGEVAITWHWGDYGSLGKSHALLTEWIEKNGYEAAGARWEVYWTDPGLEPDKSRWRTQLACPIRKKKAKAD